MTVESESITHGERVPDAHAFGVPDGEGGAAPAGGNRSPHLRWSGAPEGTASFAILVVDPDVPADPTDVNQPGTAIPEDAERVDFAHWLVVDVPAEVTELGEGAGSDGVVIGGKEPGETSFGGVAGANGFTAFLAGDEQMGGTYGHYDGPFPPFNDERLHHYHFRVYALDTPSLELSGAFELDDLYEAIEGRVLDQGEVVATYSLHPDRL
ncbi:MAG: YbhB/YbcL family Raf kinase inhibitor-like protein [Solirubrobacterales bacterium]|nr:YbhB/YbcL family Raf kinase inhibitor-like protein [Solirubrobacterales bacterium]